MTSDNLDNLTDEELEERFIEQMKRDAENITDPNELMALKALMQWVNEGE